MEEAKDRYVEEYKQREGIQLDGKLITKNPGLRAVAKICLNSFWGKFGQKNDAMKTEYISDPSKFFEIMNDPLKIVNGVQIFGK